MDGAMTSTPSGAAEAGAEQLRAAVLALKAPQAAKRAPAPRSSVYGRAAAAIPGDVRQAATDTVLAARVRSVETSALLPGTVLALLVTPARGLLPPETARSAALLVGNGAVVVALGRELPRAVSDRSQPLTVPLRADDSLADEWAVIACGPHRRVGFLARRRPDSEVWDWLVTRDPVAVQRAGTAILERVPFLKLRVPPMAAGS